MKIMGIIAGVLMVCIAAFFLFVYSGIYDVSATRPDNRLIGWTLDTVMTASVRRHAKGITVPALSDPARVQSGLRHYQEMCVACHGAPGVPSDEIGKGLLPPAPDLAKAVNDWAPAELFWIVKNGIKFTSMPAWGPSHTDKELWAMVAFMEKLPRLSPADYDALVKAQKNQAHDVSR